MTKGITIRKAHPDDELTVRSLLENVGLETDDLAFKRSEFFLAEHEGMPVGTVGLEFYGTAGLLRSAAVIPSWQGKGIGDKLTATVVRAAAQRGMRELILLTTTAEKYFARKGFTRIDRKAVQGEILSSSQFTTACPASAAVMRIALTSG